MHFHTSLASSVFRIQDDEFKSARNTPALHTKGNRSRYFAFEKEKIHPVKVTLHILLAQYYLVIYWLSPHTSDRNLVRF